MSEQQKPDWAKGLAAVGLALLIIGAIMRFAVLPMVAGGLILLCVGVATSGPLRSGSSGERREPPASWPEDRPWRSRGKQ